MARLRWAIGLFASIALVAGACTGDDGSPPQGTGGQEPVTLDLWVYPEGGEASGLEAVATEFEAAYPNIDIEWTTYPQEAYGVKIDTALAAGKGPDLALVFGPDYMRKGLLLPLDDMVAEKGIDLSTFNQAIVQEGDDLSCAYGGHLYCLGSYQGLLVMLYNKDMFDAAGIPYPEPWPPMTVDDFVDIACRLSDPDNQVWGAVYAGAMEWLPWETVVSEDGRKAQGYVNGATSVLAHETLARGILDRCAPTANIMDPWEQGIGFFVRGQLGMAIYGLEKLSKIENAGINYGVTGMPTPAGVEPYFLVWTDSLGVFKDTEHPDEAMEFIAFLATDGQRIRYEATGDLPLDIAVAEAVDWAGGIPGRFEGLEVLRHARAALFIPNRWDTFGPMFDAWGYIVSGEKTAQEALDDAAPPIQENLDKAWTTWEEGA